MFCAPSPCVDEGGARATCLRRCLPCGCGGGDSFRPALAAIFGHPAGSQRHPHERRGAHRDHARGPSGGRQFSLEVRGWEHARVHAIQRSRARAEDRSDVYAMRVHAARRQDGRLPLIPGGEIRVAALRAETIDVAGTPVPVTLYSVAGLSFAPYTVWLDADDQFFAAPGSWFARVRAGAEASLPRRQAIEEELQKK